MALGNNNVIRDKEQLLKLCILNSLKNSENLIDNGPWWSRNGPMGKLVPATLYSNQPIDDTATYEELLKYYKKC